LKEALDDINDLGLKTTIKDKPLAWRLASHEAKSSILGNNDHHKLLTKALKNPLLE